MRRLFFALFTYTAAAAPLYRVAVVHTYPHDRTAFTQGFEYHAGQLYEGTGLKGHSSIRVENLETGAIIRRSDLPPMYFGEGITVLNGHLLELTWMSKLGFIYNAANFTRLGDFHYEGEGWGLANDGRRIYFSDGTAEIRILNPGTLKEERRITVHDGLRAVNMLNELECIRGEVWANIWQTNQIVRFSPTDGTVLGWIDASGLLKPEDFGGEPVDVLNGIAYDAARNRIFLTGKLWPKIFEVRVLPAAPAH